MHKFIIVFFFTNLALLQFSCSSDKAVNRDQAYKEVMEVHDAVMPEMSTINRVKRGLNDLITQDTTIKAALKVKVEQQVAELTAAEESMLDWMKEFKQPKDSDPEEKVIAYLNEEKLKISRVRDQMLESIENGTELLNQLEEAQSSTNN